jgi:bifunctional non-homologous end joining protein LigD
MALEKYQQMRRFNETPEPAGKARKGRGPLRFVVQKHAASRLHYDFRLEIGGVLVSWAVPKGPSLNPEDKRLAMMTEDHPYEYKDFEGIIPKGNYGAGTVMIWDEGTYYPGYVDHDGQVQKTGKTRAEQDKEMRRQLHQQHLTFIMEGQKLKGEFALIKIKNSDDENAWLLVKKGDASADTKSEITSADRSATTGRSIEEIAADGDRQWTRDGESSVLDLGDTPKTDMPREVKPMLATLTDTPFDRDDWLFEVKWDGYRAIAEVEQGKAKFYSRNLQSFNSKFKPVVDSLSQLKHDAVLDGELVAVDEQGRSRFQLLQNYQKTGQGSLLYYIFDVLWLDGHDLTKLPLLRRKQILSQLLPAQSLVRYSDHIEKSGSNFFQLAQQQQLEGIIGKQADSLYRQGVRSKSWLKIKTNLRQEAVVGGFTEPRGGRQGLGALILGVYEDDKLCYIGHTGGGFTDQGLQDMHRRLQPLTRPDSPFSTIFKTNAPVTWVEPNLVVEVSFAEWTAEGHMRQPIFIGTREDKDPRAVRREVITQSPKPQNDAPLPAEFSSSANPGTELLTVGRHQLKATHLSKVFWPDEGYTKGDVINYYRYVAPLILPYLKDRPQSLNRHPNGITGKSFYQKHMETSQLPPWLKTHKVHSDSEDRDIDYLICNDEATLVYMANLGCIEINPWNSTIKNPDRPDYFVMDLDPEDIGFDAVIQTARAVHDVLDQAGVPSYPKTSGATGLHIYIPLGAKYDYEQAKEFAHLVGLLVNQKLPDSTSLERSPSKRQGKVYLDYLQNRRGQTLASAYSIRPKAGATISTPLRWDEVNLKLHPGKFTIKTIAARLDRVGDLWNPVLGKGIDLKSALKHLSPE